VVVPRLSALALVVAASCGGDLPVTEGRQTAIIYGDDDRREVHQIDDPALRDIAGRGLVALARHGDSLAATTLGERYKLCPGVRFAEQPAFARCSGVLVQPDLMLTAGHCVDRVPCGVMEVIRGFHYQADGSLPGPDALEIFRCRQVLAMRVDPPSLRRQHDYAWIRLDRPAASIAPVVVAEIDPARLAGRRVTTIGHPGGIPAKAAQGSVFGGGDQEGDFFVSSLDSFQGNSGSPVFGADARLLGVVARGDPDLAPTTAGCHVEAARPDDAASAAEEATSAGAALAGLCATRAREMGPALCQRRPDLLTPPSAPHGGAGCAVVRGPRGEVGSGWALGLLAAAGAVLLRKRRGG
jgi:hypothetical protein